MPNISVAKPSRIMPVSFFLPLLQNMYRTMPIKASTGVNDDGFSSCTHTASLWIPPRLSSHAVTVVPTLAPMMTLIACRSVSSPELTKPTTMTVVAEELWITAVIPRPVAKPANFRPVIFPSSERSLPPARRSSACPIRFIPNRNRQSPPIRFSTLKISIFFSSFTFHTHLVCIIQAQCQIQKRSFVKSM